MSCLPIVSDRAATEGSKYFELGRQPHKFLTRNTCFIISSFSAVYGVQAAHAEWLPQEIHAGVGPYFCNPGFWQPAPFYASQLEMLKNSDQKLAEY